MRQLLLALLCCASAELSSGGDLTTISGGSWNLGFDEDGTVGSFNVTVGNTGLQLVAPTQPPGQPALVSVVMGPQSSVLKSVMMETGSTQMAVETIAS